MLYRKFRPQTFDEVIGQEHITTLLKNAIKTGRIAHAYLLVGPRGLGKTTTARIIAKAVNCEHPTEDGNPCNKCASCQSITQGKFFDLIEIDAASNRGIDQIRELKERVSYRPAQGKYKVYIIDEVHMLTMEAFNALLKTLEEPPQHAIFILATTEVHKLPATVLSRCQRYDFKLGTEESIRRVVTNVLEKENKKISEDGIKLIIDSARGSFRDALSLLDVVLDSPSDADVIPTDVVRQALGLPDLTMVYYLLENLFLGKYKKCMLMLKEIYTKGISLPQFVRQIIKVFEQVMIDSTIEGKYDGEYYFLASLSDKMLLTILKIFLDAEKNLKYSVGGLLPLEMAIVQIKALLEDKGIIKNVKQVKQEHAKEVEKVLQEDESDATKPKITNKSNKKDENKSSETQNEPKAQNDISEEDVRKKWQLIIDGVKRFNGHLYAFLQQAKILSFKDGVLKLTVGYSFHKERIVSPTGKNAIQEAFFNILGMRPKIWCRVKQVSESQNSEIASRSVSSDKKQIDASNAVVPHKKVNIDEQIDVFRELI